MHWVQSTTLWQHFLCMGNSQEAIFTGIVDAVLKGEEIVQRKKTLWLDVLSPGNFWSCRQEYFESSKKRCK